MRLRAAWARENLDRRLAEVQSPEPRPSAAHARRTPRDAGLPRRARRRPGARRRRGAGHRRGVVLRRSRTTRPRPWRPSRADGAGGRTAPHARSTATQHRRGRTPAEPSARACSSPPRNDAEVARAARDAVDNLRAGDPSTKRETTGRGPGADDADVAAHHRHSRGRSCPAPLPQADRRAAAPPGAFGLGHLVAASDNCPSSSEPSAPCRSARRWRSCLKAGVPCPGRIWAQDRLETGFLRLARSGCRRHFLRRPALAAARGCRSRCPAMVAV